jgi:hypothetical protein
MDIELRQQFERLFSRLDTAFGQIDAHLTRHDARFDGIQAQLHRNGVLLAEQSKELKLAVRTFEALHQVEKERVDVVRESLDLRLRYVERAIGIQTNTEPA